MTWAGPGDQVACRPHASFATCPTAASPSSSWRKHTLARPLRYSRVGDLSGPDELDLVQRGPRTLTDKRALLAELDQVRRTGIAVNDEELESALRSIAAPVRSRSGQVVAAVNVAIPWSPATITELVGQLGPTLQTTAGQIAARGYLTASLRVAGVSASRACSRSRTWSGV